MAKIESAKKAHRGSEKKKQHNLFWKKRIKVAQKAFVAEEGQSLVNLQSVLDKAVNNKVIHKNKASRLKSRFAKKLAIKK
ncbi:30S ribosomal protein S20 [candidate division WWE3 bacterium CG08_land_8_20_14_0_20_41_10]|uniref:Small ribosomal subunit protein bS20 n=1 Tax=candidate division WWE3 bacterium CG08_land_8_20_14_0_20_41_10 TaxID=1975085 RepID=A0A2H0XCY9_UNCKA|nr:MAG: 30S ribosomal protein S20 [candidate division WWE3 bacterium CG08_land_8_20_14_0_20_41_10]